MQREDADLVPHSAITRGNRVNTMSFNQLRGPRGINAGSHRLRNCIGDSGITGDGTVLP